MKIKAKMMDFLDHKGYELGYHESLMPHIADLDTVCKNSIQVWEYMGYRSEKSYYTRNKPSMIALKEIIKKYGMYKREYWETPKPIKNILPKMEEFNNNEF